MKTKLFFWMFLMVSLGIPAQIVSIPDTNFKALLLLSSPTYQIAKDHSGNWVKIDANNDGEIQQSEADNISWLFAGDDYNHNYHIQSITGIKSFNNVTDLRIQAAQLSSSLDLSNMSSLTSLTMHSPATSANLSGLVNLQLLDCSSNNFTTLDLSGLNNLEILYAYFGNLSSINFPNSNLKQLKINHNNLTALDVSQYTQLTYLDCSENQISTLNLTGLNQLETLDVKKNLLTSLNLSGCNSLNILYCYNNLLTTLDLSNKPYLTDVYSSSNLLQNINITNSSNIEYLHLYDNKLTGFLDLSSLTKILGIHVGKNLLTKLDASNGKYHNLNGSNNYLYISDNPNLETLIFKNISPNASYIDGIFYPTGFSNLPVFKHICCDENYKMGFAQSLLTQNIKKVMVVTDCNFSLNCTQNITIPDPNFKQYLVENFDFNNDGEICDSEAEKAVIINCPNLNIGSSQGLGSFKNIMSLNISHNQIPDLELSNLKSLTTLNCTYNNLTLLDTSENIKLEGLDFNNNPSLQKLFIKNGGMQYIANYVSPTEIYSDYTFLNTDIQYVCADDSELEMVNAVLAHEGKTASVSSYCTSVPGGNYNTITGTVRFDENNNGCDTSDEIFEHMKLKIDDGTTTGETFVKSSGNYDLYIQAGSFTVTAEPENPALFTVTPASFNVNFADSNNNISTQNICVTKNGTVNDLEVVIAPVTDARPGFDATYKLIWRNKGNTTLSGSAVLTFDASKMSFVSSVLPSTVSGSQVTFSFTNLKPYQNKASEITFNINAPTHPTHPVNIGDILNFSAGINPTAGDLNPSDNLFSFNQTVVGSFDPNDITCLEGSQIPLSMVGKYLHYMVNFENTGTAPATNIVVEMNINPDDFDVSSLQLQNTSHSSYTKVTGNKVEFIMKDINLAAAAHGNVALKLKSKNNLVSGDSVTNHANIYFDYNFPVETNEANTTVTNATLQATDAVKEDISANIYPNPTQGEVNVEAGSKIRFIEVYDAQGRIIQKHTGINSEKTKVMIHSAASGVYFFKIITEKNTLMKKVIKN
ncbi:Leucine-rich repeat (LRR) protein [Chryseobacterium defluvii]|uniref:Leucine-rich repeat (LRR) protein n=1 Tax=Chryseobacterium defluvii TaxID=160396 RepID=A0A840KD56_9FLAO|nr:T9SS type A sorting domain-containing protein [Chryseobacterium defluvii]MBB4806455.1 Leucine-rich repeat (LRR) protein [Chryseobacterium defluvii]